MTDTGRRDTLRIMGFGLGLSALSLPVALSATPRTVRFPQGAIRLTRTLERSLGDGAAIVARRSWECRFHPDGEGARIEARQVAVEVDVPPALSQLGEIERRREVTGLFPMSLDSAGRIADWARGDSNLDEAIANAHRAIERQARQPADKADARQYVAAIGRAAAALVSQVPRDLFYPEQGERREERALDLPDGGQGSYEVTISASARPQDGLLQRSERRIVTRIGKSTRTSREVWSIA